MTASLALQSVETASLPSFNPAEPSFCFMAATRPRHSCAGCGGAGLKSCSRCKLTFYCGRDCQRRHWPSHKPLCKPAPATKGHPREAVTLIEDVVSKAAMPLREAMIGETMQDINRIWSQPLSRSQREARDLLKANGTDVDANDRDPTGDGDQSMLYDDVRRDGKNQYRTFGNAQPHRDLWCAGGDLLPLFQQQLLPEFAVACLTGQVGTLQRVLDQARLEPGDSLHRVLETRWSNLRVTPLIMTLVGALRIVGPGSNHLACARALVEAGCRIAARDVVGKTVVHYGGGAVSDPRSREIVKYCAGVYDARRAVGAPRLADVQDRFGTVALHEVVIAQNMEIIEFLLKECSASPTIKDNTGLSPMQMSFGPRMKSFMSKYATIRSREALKQCANPECKSSGVRSCSRCHTVYYCSKDCQRAHWRDHKAACKDSASSTVRMAPGSDPLSIAMSSAKVYNMQKGTTHKGGSSIDVDSDEEFVVKVQLAQQLGGGTGGGNMLVYDKSRRVFFYCGAADVQGFERLERAIRDKGVGGAKGYFPCRPVRAEGSGASPAAEPSVDTGASPDAVDSEVAGPSTGTSEEKNKKKKKKKKKKKQQGSGVYTALDVYVDRMIVQNW